MRPLLLVPLATLGLILTDLPADRLVADAAAPAVYSYLPTSNVRDGRMLCRAGTPLQTLASGPMEVRIAVPSTMSSFELGIFDGDTGKNASGQLVDPGGAWDSGTQQLEYDLYLDRFGDGTGQTLVGHWTGNGVNATQGPRWTASRSIMPDNDWWTVNVRVSSQARAPSGHYFYRLVVHLPVPGASVESAFKLRSTAQLSLHPGTFGFMGVLNQYTDAYLLFPTWAGDYPPADPFFFVNAPTTYDGSWRFPLEVTRSTSDLRVWDGDLDVGTFDQLSEPAGIRIPASADTDDADTPPGIPDWSEHLVERSEAAQGTGNPEDDRFLDLLRRSPDIRYSLTDPQGRLYRNDNPSGDLEWEQFRVTSEPVNSDAADYSPLVAADGVSLVREARLPAGIWDLNVAGQDLGNLSFLHTDYRCLGVDATGAPITPLCPFTLGDLVWIDSDRNGFPGKGEHGIGDVVVNLRDEDGVLLGTTVTASDGSYHFEVEAGSYFVEMAQSNFGPGRSLAGLQSTTGGISRAVTVLTSNVDTADFGFHAKGDHPGPGQLAGCVWWDEDGDALQDLDEPGFQEVTVVAHGDTNADGVPDLVRSTVTDSEGVYRFPGLPSGRFTIVIAASTLPPGLQATYDPDGLWTRNFATLSLTAEAEISGFTFGYTFPKKTGPYITYTQGGWGAKPQGENAAALLSANFATVYSGGSVTIGGRYTLRFTAASAIEAFLPQGGTPEPLQASAVNPTTRLSVLAGQVLALRLNVDFAKAGVTRTGLSALIVASGPLQGYTVGEVLTLANQVLGGTLSALPPGLTVAELNDVVTAINENFDGGTVNYGYLTVP